MRKIITASFIVLGLFFSKQAQSQNFRFGLKASPLITWTKSDDKSIGDPSIKGGFNYGLTFEYFLTENYGASSGLTITHKGGKLSYQEPQYTDTTAMPFNIKEGEEVKQDTFTRPTVNNSFQYLEIPITLKLKTNEIGYMTYFGQFGIAPGINISSKADISGTALNGDTKERIDVNVIKDTKPFNLALHLGAGFEYNLGGNTSFVLGLYFNNGFTDVTKYDENKVILNHLALRLGVLF